jgi:signal transduction histidine kinase
MKSVRTGISLRLSPLPLANWVRRTKDGATSARLFTRDGVPSVDGLDAAIRGFGVAIVVILSLFGYGSAQGLRPDSSLVNVADPLLVAAGLIVYNLIIITIVGVPWRHTPGFALFVLDWLVASTAILLTGGFLSPFNILYYALVIGAALRVGLQRSVLLVICCALMYALLSLLHPEPEPAVRLPLLVVQIASLAMVMFMSVGMKRAVEVEARKVELEELAANQLRLLNKLTTTVLSGELDLEHVVRTIASVSSEAVHADSGLAVLFGPTYPLEEAAADSLSDDDLILVADCEPNPAMLSACERRVLERVAGTGQPVLIHDAHGESQGAIQSLSRVQRGNPPYPGLGRAGSEVSAVACVPFLLDGRAIGALFVGRRAARLFTAADVSLLTAISQQMAVAVRLARLYDLEREKAVRSEEREHLERDLLSTVSHELRTPLTSIKTCVSALTEFRPGTSNRSLDMSTTHSSRMLNNIERSTERLINLVNELLDMSRLRAGRVTLSLQELNLGEVLLESATQVRPLLESRQQTITLDLPTRGSARWYKLNALADRKRIEQVLLNLLSNANKYGPVGSKIVMGATPRDGAVKVFVRDEGPGIARYEHRLIFDKFYQGSATTAGGDRPDSTGLGLAIARSIVELHGGQIGVYSKLGAGSTFYFTLHARN